jgi:hypothetical protein
MNSIHMRQLSIKSPLGKINIFEKNHKQSGIGAFLGDFPLFLSGNFIFIYETVDNPLPPIFPEPRKRFVFIQGETNEFYQGKGSLCR